MVDTAPPSGAEGDLARDLIDASSSVTASETPSGPRTVYAIIWSSHDLFAPLLGQSKIFVTDYWPLAQRLAIRQDARATLPGGVVRHLKIKPFDGDLASIVTHAGVQVWCRMPQREACALFGAG